MKATSSLLAWVALGLAAPVTASVPQATCQDSNLCAILNFSDIGCGQAGQDIYLSYASDGYPICWSLSSSWTSMTVASVTGQLAAITMYSGPDCSGDAVTVDNTATCHNPKSLDFGFVTSVGFVLQGED